MFLSISIFEQVDDFHENSYERNAIGGQPKAADFNILELVMKI
jgi:hypothetical protein